MMALATHTSWSRESILSMPFSEVIADLEALKALHEERE